MKILLDNGHGINTPGKCSPDRRLLEWKWTREITQRVSRILTLRGVDCVLLTPEEHDVTIAERVRRANSWCAKLGAKNVLLVSIHVNAAASDGKWHNARGFSVFVAPKSSEASKRCAKIFTEAFTEAKLMGNRCVPTGKYWEGNFGIIRDSKCPAVLTENLFQDNKEDVEYLLSEEGKVRIAQLHADAICKYISQNN